MKRLALVIFLFSLKAHLMAESTLFYAIHSAATSTFLTSDETRKKMCLYSQSDSSAQNNSALDGWSKIVNNINQSLTKCMDEIKLEQENATASQAVFVSAVSEKLVSSPSSSTEERAVEESVMECQVLDLSKDCFSQTVLEGNFFTFAKAFVSQKPQMSPALGHKKVDIFAKTEPVNTQISLTDDAFKKHCDCLRDKLKREQIALHDDGQDEELEKKLNIEREKINEKIIQEFGKKFINKYAANLEDASFFLSWNSKMFGNREQLEKAKDFQCNNHETYSAAVAKECPNKAKVEVEERMNKFLSAFDGDTSKRTLEESLNHLNEEVLLISRDGNTFSRYEFDKARFGFSREPKVKVAENIVAKIVSNKAYQTQVIDLLRDKDIDSPSKAIGEWLATEQIRDPVEFQKKFLTKEILGEEQYRNFIMGPLKDNPVAFLADALMHTIGSHPGFANALAKKEEFLKMGEKFRAQKGNGLISLLESDPDILPPLLEKRCKNLVEEFASAVCAEDMDLLKKVNRSNLEKVIKAVREENKTQDPRLHGLLLCNSLHFTGDKAFSDVGSEPAGFDKSDYFDRKTKPFDQQKNAFTEAYRQSLNKNKSPIRDALYRIANSAQSSGYSTGGVLSQEISTAAALSGKAITFSKINERVSKDAVVAQSSGQILPTAHSELSYESPTREPASSPISSSAHYYAPSERKASNHKIKNEMSQFLSKDRDSDEVRKHLDNLDDKALLELKRIKEESLRDQERLLKLSNQNEELKLKALQKKVQNLMNKKQELVGASSDEKRIEEASEVESGRKISGNHVSTPKVSANQEGAAASTPAASQTNGSIAPSSSNLERSSPGTIKSDVRETSEVSRSSTSSSSKSVGAIIIQSNATKSFDKEVAPKELSQEVITYLMEAKPDLTTLKQMKEKGMLYKFKTLKDGVYVEKEVLIPFDSLTADAKKLIESKIAEKDTLVSELDRQIASVTREHSFQTLKLILGEQLQKP